MATQRLPIRQSDADPLRAVAVVLRRRRLARRAAMAWPRPLQRALGPVAIAKSSPRSLSESHSSHAVVGALRREPTLAALPRRLVELHECRVRCWALSSSGAARSKRSASDCRRWQRYVNESCWPSTRYRAPFGSKSAVNPSCSPAQLQRGKAHSSPWTGCSVTEALQSVA